MPGSFSFDEDLDLSLEELEKQDLRRSLRLVRSAQGPVIELNGRSVLNFASNDYLGFATAPELKEAAIRAVERYGAGAGSSRLLCGSLSPHLDLEEALAHFKQTEAALTFATGYATAMGVICALLGREDIVVLDKLVHASIVDAARLSGATMRVFAHNDLGSLEKILKWADSPKGTNSIGHRPRVLVATETIFSMDGDQSSLREIIALKEEYGAWLMIDEAHATGMYGIGRRGLAEHFGVSDRIEIQMGTLGKALGAAGGYICGSRKLVDLLVNRARPFIFSTAPVPASAAAAKAGVELVQAKEGQTRCAHLWERVRQFHQAHSAARRNVLSPILPLIIGAERDALDASSKLLEEGVYLPAIRYPTVARGQARLRVSFSAAHEPTHVEKLIQSVKAWCSRQD